MKKLLILGGSRYILPIIKSAHKLGVYVITCDYLPDNIAHKYSDKYCNVSIIDKEAVLNLAKEKKIDGIMSFACDPGVETAAYVAEKLGLPSCGPYESVCILQNKGKFRKFLEENGFNVPMSRVYNDIETAKKDVKLFQWPIIVKPTDSAGSKGVTRVDNENDLKESIENALKFSHNHEFIIEEFLEKKGCSSDCDCFSVDGKLKFVSFSAQRFDKNAINPYVPAGFSWPETISKSNREELTNEIQRLLNLLNMKTSVYNIETREAINGKPYIMECSPRGGGNRLSEMVRYMAGIDLLEDSVKAALGEKIIDDFDKEIKGNWAEVILHGNKSGYFQSLEISESIKKYVIEEDLWIKKGDKVENFSGANQTIGTLVMKFENSKDVENFFDNQDKYIKVNIN